MNETKINLHAFIPAILLLTSYILSPAFYHVLPGKYATLIGGISGISTILFPKLFEKQKNAEVKQEGTPTQES